MVLPPPGNSQNRRDNLWTREEVGPSRKKRRTKTKGCERGLGRLALFYDCLEHPVKMVWCWKPNPPPTPSFPQPVSTTYSALLYLLLPRILSHYVCVSHRAELAFRPRTPAVLLWVPCAVHFPDGAGKKEAQYLIQHGSLWATFWFTSSQEAVRRVGQCLHFKYLTVALVLSHGAFV